MTPPAGIPEKAIMPRKKTNELAAGTFILVALAATFGVVVWLGAAEIFRPARQRAFFYAEEADGSIGLEEGNTVEINSLPIGKIVSIRYLPQERRTLYEAQIHYHGATIHSDAVAAVTTGLVGVSKLTVTNRGTDDSPPADEKNAVRVTGGLDAAISQLSDAARKINAELDHKPDAMMGKVDDILKDVKTTTDVLARIAATLGPETRPGDPQSMIVNLRQSMSNANAMTGNLKRETDAEEEDSLAAKAHATMDDFKAIAADAKPKVSNLLDSASEAAARLEEYTKRDVAEIFTLLRKSNDKILTIANDFATVSDTTKKIVVLNRENIDTMIDNMTQVSATLKAASEEIRANPWRLLRKPAKEDMETYGIMTAASSFSEGATSLNQALTKLKSLDPKVFQADDPQIQGIRRHLEESFEKFKEVEDALYDEMRARPS